MINLQLLQNQYEAKQKETVTLVMALLEKKKET